MARPLVLIPSYQDRLNADELTSLDAALRHLGGYDWAIVGPINRYVGRHGAIRLETPPTYWESRRSYNALMVAPGLYRQIMDIGYSHVLVHQLDAIVFSDRLAEFCLLDYDYVGAPTTVLGMFDACNGGLSLRRLDAFLRVLDGMADWPTVESYYAHWGVNEDVFWSLYAQGIDDGFKVASIHQACTFAWESSPDLCWILNRHELPFGAHAWAKHSPEFWANLGGVRALAGLPEPLLRS